MVINEYLKKNPIAAKTITLFLLVVISLLFSLKLWKMREAVIDEKNTLFFERRDLALLDQLVEDAESEEQAIESTLSSLPQTYIDVAELAYKIEAIAELFNLDPTISFDEEPKEEGKVFSLGIELSTVGGYQNYSYFLTSLNNLPYNSTVEGIEIESEEGLSQTTNIKVYLRK